MSMRISSGRSFLAIVSPSSAFRALITVWPADSSRYMARVMFAALSSTTRTRAISVARVASRHGASDFRREPVAVEVGLFHDRRHVAVQPGAILVGDVHGGHDEDRDAGGRGTFLKRSDDVEAVRLRHHEIEDDQV